MTALNRLFVQILKIRFSLEKVCLHNQVFGRLMLLAVNKINKNSQEMNLDKSGIY